jgi:hypothetical protein
VSGRSPAVAKPFKPMHDAPTEVVKPSRHEMLREARRELREMSKLMVRIDHTLKILEKP